MRRQSSPGSTYRKPVVKFKGVSMMNMPKAGGKSRMMPNMAKAIKVVKPIQPLKPPKR